MPSPEKPAPTIAMSFTGPRYPRGPVRVKRGAAASPALFADDLPGGDVQAVPDVDRRDGAHARAELRLVEVLGGGVPDRVGHRVGPIREAAQGLGQGERGALGFA